MQITLEQARTFLALLHFSDARIDAGGSPSGQLNAHVRRLGCVQYDPLDVVGRNADLVLQSRVSGYRPELLYRALLYRGLAARLPRAALPLSAAFFAFLHRSPHHFLPLFLLALLLGIAFRRYGLAASAGLHAGFNGANLLAGILLV